MAGGFNMNEEKHLLLPMDLQFFADEPNSDEPNSDNSNESGNSSTKDSQNPKMKIQTEKKLERLLPVKMYQK